MPGRQESRGQELADALLSPIQTRAGNAAQRTYLLLDQAAFAQASSYWALWPEARCHPIFPNAHEQPDLATPLLFDVTDAHYRPSSSHRVRVLCHAAAYANALSCITSGLSGQQLAAALQLRTQAKLPQNLNVVLRFFDTRVLPLLPRLLTPQQYSSFMQCAVRWHFLDRWGQQVSMPPAGVVAGPEDKHVPLVFDNRQEALLIDDGLCDAVIDKLLDSRHPALRGLTPPQQYERVSTWVDAAQQHGFREVLDVLEFCHATHAQGDGFAQTYPWRERLAQVASGGLSLQEALRGA